MHLHVTVWFEDLKQRDPLGRPDGMTDCSRYGLRGCGLVQLAPKER
jgi:hypothetical protein